MNAALYFAPDAYVLEGNQIMGRRTAGAAFLRAAVEGRGGGEMVGYTGGQSYVDSFIKTVKAIDPTAEARCIALGNHAEVAKLGVLHRADPALAAEARLRLRSSPAAFSLTGITHTLLSSGTLQVIGSLLSEPLMPWDALICTSSVALDVVRSILDDAADYARWRFGSAAAAERLQLPVIPLGIHAADWSRSDQARAAARRQMGIAADDVVLLFAGRLSFAAKAHPFQMFEALRLAAERTGRRLTLLLAGQFFNEKIESHFMDMGPAASPNVICRHVDGADADLYAAAYAASDVFLSLADNMQETFGITPLEAMAAALPVVVSDWNGYKDTVRDGVDGFRIPCWAPGAGAGLTAAQAYELTDNYDFHSSRTSTTVSVDIAVLVDRLAALIGDPALRRRMGEAGRARVLAEFDWPVVYRHYQALWSELNAIRRHRSAEAVMQRTLAAAPRAHPAHEDVFRRFASYPTSAITGATTVRAAPHATRAAYEAITARPYFSFWRMPPALAEAIFAAAASPVTVEALGRAIGRPVEAAMELTARLAKMNLVILGDGAI